MTDVIVVGAGIVGTAVARELAVRGVETLLVDRGAVASGTTGRGEGNILVSDKHPGPGLELTLAALAVYDELEERLGGELRIRHKGALVVHRDEATWAGEPARIAQLGVPAHTVVEEELQRLEPALTGPVLGATLVPGDRQCDARAVARALAREAVDAGAEVSTGIAVEAVEVAAGRVRGVRTDGGRLRAGAVVLAAGAWTAPLAASAGLALPLEPRKGQLVRLRAPAPGYVRHKVIEASYLDTVHSAEPGLQLSPVVETTWEDDVLVGSSRERRGFDAGVDPAVSDAMVERAALLFPGLRALEVLDAWAGLRPWLPDGLPAIGPSGAVPGLWVAAGHEGAGVALGPVTGRLVAQLYGGEPPVVDPAPFAPDRFAGAAG